MPRLVFAGTPNFAVPSLQALLDAQDLVEVVAVLTQPDRPAGRGRQVQSGPVKQLAIERRIPLLQPLSLRDAAVQDALHGLSPDLMVVAAYGLILPQGVLDTPELGCVNVHASLLPRWRGAAPIARAIEAGDVVTGITLMQMAAGLDTGPVLARSETSILMEDTAATLQTRLAQLGGRLLADSLAAILSSSLPAVPQEESAATYARKLERDEAPIDWSRPATEVANKVRALNPWPVAETCLGTQRLRIWHANAVTLPDHRDPGVVIAADREGVVVACGEGSVCLTELQRIGGKVLRPGDFLNGFAIKAGDRFS